MISRSLCVNEPLHHNPRRLLHTNSLPGSRVISRMLHPCRSHRYYKLRIVTKCRNLYLLHKDYNRVIVLMITVVSLLTTPLVLYHCTVEPHLYSHLFYLNFFFATTGAWASLKVHPHWATPSPSPHHWSFWRTCDRQNGLHTHLPVKVTGFATELIDVNRPLQREL